MNLELIKSQNLGSLLMKSSQSNFDLRSPSSYLARSYLIATVSLEKSMVSFDLKISINSISLGLYPLQFLNAPVPLTFICILQLKNLHLCISDESEPSCLEPQLKLKDFQLSSARLVAFSLQLENLKIVLFSENFLFSVLIVVNDTFFLEMINFLVQKLVKARKKIYFEHSCTLGVSPSLVSRYCEG